MSSHSHHQWTGLIAVGLALIASTVAARYLLAADISATAATSSFPSYDLKVGVGEWEKLERTADSDDRHPARFTANGKEYSVEVRYRGDWARSWPKKPLKVFFEKEKDFEGRHVLNLNPNWRDPAFIREQLAYHIYSACGVPAPETRLVKLNVNGEFYGVFLEVEQPAKAFLKRVELKGAAVYKANSRRWLANESDLGEEAAFHAHYEKENHKDEDYRDLQTFCHELSAAKDVVEFFNTRVDLDRYINFLAASALVQNWDWYSKNHFLVYDAGRSKKWLVVPWDLDRTLGDHWAGPFDAADLPLQLGTHAQPGTIGWNKLFDALYNEPVLRKRLLDRLEVLLTTEFTKEKLFPVLDRWESEISTDVALDRQRWPNRGAENLHVGIVGVKQYIEDRRAYLFREIKAKRAGTAARR